MMALVKAAAHSLFLAVLYIGVGYIFGLDTTVGGAATAVAVGAMVRTYSRT